jgi:hypothetical protein
MLTGTLKRFVDLALCGVPQVVACDAERRRHCCWVNEGRR